MNGRPFLLLTKGSPSLASREMAAVRVVSVKKPDRLTAGESFGDTINALLTASRVLGATTFRSWCP